MRDLAGALAFTQSLWGAELVREKHPDDLRRHVLLLERVKPNLVIETGLHWGIGARWLAERVPHVYTVERDAQMIYDYREDTHGFGPQPENVTVFEGDSVTRAGDVAELARYREGPVYVILDSDHGTDHVFREMCAYSALVTPGSYMVVEDGIYHYFPPGRRHEGNWYDGDPVEAIGRFLGIDPPDDPTWQVDDAIEEMYPATMNPRGWLRRI